MLLRESSQIVFINEESQAATEERIQEIEIVNPIPLVLMVMERSVPARGGIGLAARRARQGFGAGLGNGTDEGRPIPCLTTAFMPAIRMAIGLRRSMWRRAG
jgi:hypothetical protein